jgi:hypothetical protein
MAYRGQNGTVVSCICSRAKATSGSAVWGTDYYTDDSALCVAAVHAGRITFLGGTIHAVITGERNSYIGSHRNGVVSESWGRFSGSYYFQ